eukprot:g16071.t1
MVNVTHWFPPVIESPGGGGYDVVEAESLPVADDKPGSDLERGWTQAKELSPPNLMTAAHSDTMPGRRRKTFSRRRTLRQLGHQTPMGGGPKGDNMCLDVFGVSLN